MNEHTRPRPRSQAFGRTALAPLTICGAALVLAACGAAPTGRTAGHAASAASGSSQPAFAGPAGTSAARAIPIAAVAELYGDGPKPRALFGAPALRIGGELREARLVFSPDERLLIAGSDDGLVRLFDASTGMPVAALRAHRVEVTRVVLAPGGGLLTGDEDGEIVLWRPGRRGLADATGESLPSRHNKAIAELALSRDGSTLLSADQDGNSFVWDLKARTVRAALDQAEDSGDGVTVSSGLDEHFVVSPDGKHAVGRPRSGSPLTLWSLGEPKRLRTLRAPGLDNVLELGFDADGRLRVLQSERHGPGLRVAHYSLDGKRLDARALPLAEGSSALSPDGTRLAVTHAGLLKIVRVADGGTELELRVGEPDRDERNPLPCFSPLGNRLALLGGEQLVLVDVRERYVLTAAGGNALGRPQAFALRSGKVAAMDDGWRLYLFSPDTAAPAGVLPLGASALDLSADGGSLVGLSSHLFRMNVATHELTLEQRAERAVTVSADHRRLAELGPGEIVVRAADSAAKLQSIAVGERYVEALLFSPDGSKLASVSHDGMLFVHEVAGGRELGHAKLGFEPKSALGWWPDGIWLTGAQSDGGKLLAAVDPRTLKVVSQAPAGDLCVRARAGGWSAWRTPAGVVVTRADGSRCTLPDGLGAASALGFDDAGERLLVGRLGAVEVWATADLVASGRAARADASATTLLPPPPPAPPGKDRYGDPLPPYALARLGTTRGRAPREVEDLTFAGRSSLWVLGEWGRAMPWDLGAGRPLRTVEADGSAGHAVAFVTPDERYVVARGVLSLGVWDAKTGAELKKLARKEGDDESSMLSPTGTMLATGAKDGSITLWSVPELGATRRLAAHPGEVTALAFSRDGKRLGSCSKQGSLRLWDAKTGKLTREVTGLDEYGCRALAFSPDGGTLYLAQGTWVELFDARNGKKLATLKGEQNIASLVLSPSGDRLAVAAHGKELVLWDTASRQPAKKLAFSGNASAVAFSPDGKRLAVSGEDEVVRVLDASSFAELGPRPSHSEPLTALAAGPEPGTVLAADRSGLLRKWRIDGASVEADARGKGYGYLALTERGVVFVADKIELRKPGDLALLGDIDSGSAYRAAATRDGRLAATLDRGRCKLWDLGKRALLREIEAHANYADAVAFSPDGKLLATGGSEGVIRLFETSSFADRTTIRVGAAVKSIHFVPDGSIVVWSGRQEGSSPLIGATRLLDGKRLWELQPTFSTSDDLALSDDGKLLATADHEGFHFYQPASGKPIATLPAPDNDHGLIAFSRDRKRLYSQSAETTILVWDTSWLP